MNLEIEGKVIFVSGSTRGIGLGIVKVLLEEGCRVVLNGRNKDELEQAEEELKKKYPEKIFAVQGDVNSIPVLEEIKNEIRDRWGYIDGIVANAGAVKNIPAWQIEKEDWNWYFSSNFSVSYNTVQAFVPMLSKRQGAIVTIGSIAGIEDVGAPLPYAAAKAALIAYTKSLSRRLADKNIRVNMVSPGNILFPGGNWDRKQKSNPDQVQNMIQKNVPLQMFGEPEDIGVVVAFLLSPKARFITGANIVVDGGQTSRMS